MEGFRRYRNRIVRLSDGGRIIIEEVIWEFGHGQAMA